MTFLSDKDFKKQEEIKKSSEALRLSIYSDSNLPLEFIEKSQHHEMVKVVRDGKTFYQYRLVGSNKIEDNISTGDYFNLEDLKLTITKYSEKSFLISGDTYKNIELLREIKKELGLGTWNKSLNGWIFPYSNKDSIMSLLASKSDISTFEGTIEKENILAIKNSVNIGSDVEIGGVKVKVKDITSEDGKAIYKVNIDGKEIESKEIDLSIPQETDTNKISELINSVDESNRFQVGKELFGKEAGANPISDAIEKTNEIIQKAKVIEVTSRSGEKVSALDYSFINQKDIQLVNQEDILDKQKPNWCPDINEKTFSGWKDKKFVFDYVKLDDDRILLAVNGFEKGNMGADNIESDYAIVSLDQLVATQDYYQKKRKAEIAKAKDDSIKKRSAEVLNWDEKKMGFYYPFDYERRLSPKQKEKYTKEQWESLSNEQKVEEIPNMKHPVFKVESHRISQLDEHTMMVSNFSMYKKYVDKSYLTPKDKKERTYNGQTDPAAIEYKEIREALQWKKVDMKVQREENNATYDKAFETSFGESNTKDYLLESHGVKIKSQNGKEISPLQIEQIRDSLGEVYASFGDRSEMSKKAGMKISHSGEKLMFARKALGIFIPSMNTIGVSNREKEGKFGFTLAHEFAHFMDHHLGAGKRNYASDNYNSTAGKIANEFRKNMNKNSDSDYINRTNECFARALEQYHAMKTGGVDAIKYQDKGVAYHNDDNHVSKEKFTSKIVPLIENFFNENNHLLKSLFTSNLEKAFNILKFT